MKYSGPQPPSIYIFNLTQKNISPPLPFFTVKLSLIYNVQPPMRLPVLSWLFLMVIYSLLLSISVFGVSGQCFGNQQSSLLQLKNNLTFDPAMSKNLVNWNQMVDCCSWEGVTCNEGRVLFNNSLVFLFEFC
jgi:hypothetical protein